MGHVFVSQGIFFPAAYLGFLAVLSVLILTVTLAFLVLLTDEACYYSKSESGRGCYRG